VVSLLLLSLNLGAFVLRLRVQRLLLCAWVEPMPNVSRAQPLLLKHTREKSLGIALRSVFLNRSL
jgi:hypothetical protein